MWCRFLAGFKGVVYFLKEWFSDQNLNLFTNSSGSPQLEYGMYFDREWCFFSCPLNWKYINGRREMTL